MREWLQPKKPSSNRIASNRSQRLSAAEAEVAELQRRLADMTRVVFAPDKINVFADDWRVAAQGAV